jgi:aminoglycoside phosphotransferase (APT) family kinase protein
LLIRDGRLNAVIDFGCLAAGDPACDLAIAWVFFDGESREAFRAGVVADSGTWARARGWALWKAALVLASNSPINPYENRPIDVIAAVVEEHRRQG